MNRANFGNQITNGMQILSVAGTTASGMINSSRQRHLADATSGLNNLSDDELNMIGQMRSDKYRSDIAEHITEKAGESVDTIMEDGLFERLRSPQAKEMRIRAKNDIEWLKNYTINQKQEEKQFSKELGNVIKKEEKIQAKRNGGII